MTGTHPTTQQHLSFECGLANWEPSGLTTWATALPYFNGALLSPLTFPHLFTHYIETATAASMKAKSIHQPNTRSFSLTNKRPSEGRVEISAHANVSSNIKAILFCLPYINNIYFDLNWAKSSEYIVELWDQWSLKGISLTWNVITTLFSTKETTFLLDYIEKYLINMIFPLWI